MGLKEKIHGLRLLIKKRGVAYTVQSLYRSRFYYLIKGKNEILEKFKDLRGIEIGGPSSFFERHLPIYKIAKVVDGVNFSTKTIWEGNLIEGRYYKYSKGKVGYQYILDGVNISQISDESYDFCLSCNNLEHIANPLKALIEWTRVTRHSGYIVLVLPNKENNFDHKRPNTTFEHLLEDYKNDTDEDDLTHLEEILQLHDLTKDVRAGNFENFKWRCLNNLENRCMHHHVFGHTVLRRMLSFCGCDTIYVSSNPIEHIIIGQKR